MIVPGRKEAKDPPSQQADGKSGRCGAGLAQLCQQRAPVLGLRALCKAKQSAGGTGRGGLGAGDRSCMDTGASQAFRVKQLRICDPVVSGDTSREQCTAQLGDRDQDEFLIHLRVCTCIHTRTPDQP